MHAPKNHIKTTGRPPSQAAFDLLRKTKQRWVSQGFALQAIPRSGRDVKLHFCVITSKKACAQAVDRNRVRRRLRAVALEILPVHATSDVDYMIVARREALDRPYETMKNDMLWCLKRLDLLKS